MKLLLTHEASEEPLLTRHPDISINEVNFPYDVSLVLHSMMLEGILSELMINDILHLHTYLFPSLLAFVSSSKLHKVALTIAGNAASCLFSFYHMLSSSDHWPQPSPALSLSSAPQTLSAQPVYHHCTRPLYSKPKHS